MINEPVLKQLIIQGETNRVDFKRELDLDTGKGKAELIKDILSIANSGNDTGFIIIGIDDDKNIFGIDEIQEERIQQLASTYITPPVMLQCSVINLNFSSELQVGVIEIHATHRPHKVAHSIDKIQQNEVFVRHGSVVLKASPEEIITMHSESKILPEWKHYIQAAETHVKLDNLQNAITSYTKAIELMPTADILLARGKLYRIIQKDDLALHDLSGAIRLPSIESIEKEARFERVRILADKGLRTSSDWLSDINWLKERVTGKELGELFYLEAHNIEADTWLFEEYEEETIRLLDKAIEYDYLIPNVYFYRSRANCGMCNYGLALNDINIAIEKIESDDRQLEEYLLFKINILRLMQKLDDAYELFIGTHQFIKDKQINFMHFLDYHQQVVMLGQCLLDYNFCRKDIENDDIFFKKLIMFFWEWNKDTLKKHPYLKKMYEWYPKTAQLIDKTINNSK